MKDPSFPPRLAESRGEDDFIRDALRAVKDETMGPSGVVKTLARFEAIKLQGALPLGASSNPTSWWRSTFAARLGGSIAILSAIGIGLLVRNASTEAPAPSAAFAVVQVSQSAPAPSPTTETTATTRVEDLPAAPSAVEGSKHASPARASGVSSTSPATSRSPASSFHEELALVEAARSALAAGDSAGCFQALDRHDERFRGGVFADEIIVMRIEALTARGEHSRARKLGESFLARRPDTAYAGRIRSILSTTP